MFVFLSLFSYYLQNKNKKNGRLVSIFSLFTSHNYCFPYFFHFNNFKKTTVCILKYNQVLCREKQVCSAYKSGDSGDCERKAQRSCEQGRGKMNKESPQSRRRMYYMTNLFMLKKLLKGNYGIKEDRTKNQAYEIFKVS